MEKTKLTFLILMGGLLFLLPIATFWLGSIISFSDQSLYSAAGGVFPHSDAGGYWIGAKNFLETGQLGCFGARRPLNTLFLAVRLWLTQGSFHYSLLLQGILGGISCAVFSVVIGKNWGRLAGMTTYGVLFVFASSFLPTTLTEMLGLTLGALALTALFLNDPFESKWVFALALFTLTVALNTRAGPFLVLPVLFIWILRETLKDRSLEKTTALMLCFFSVVVGFLLPFFLTHSFGDGSGGVHANFAHTLYGLVSGGKSWTYADEQFPNFQGTEAEYAKFLYIQSWQTFVAHPLLIFKGLLKSIGELFKFLLRLPIIFLPKKMGDNLILEIMRYTFSVLVVTVGVFRFYKIYHQNKNQLRLIVILFAGVLLSELIVWTDGGVRVMAVVIPIWAALFGITLSNRKFHTIGLKEKGFLTHTSLGLALLIIAVSSLIPFMIGGKDLFKEEANSMSYLKKQPYLVIDDPYGSGFFHLSSERYAFLINGSTIEDKISYLKVLNQSQKNEPFVLILTNNGIIRRADVESFRKSPLW